MLVELNRSQIISLLTGIQPGYEWIQELEHRGFGKFVGGFVERFEWDHVKVYNSKLFDEDLYELYQELRRSEE